MQRRHWSIPLNGYWCVYRACVETSDQTTRDLPGRFSSEMKSLISRILRRRLNAPLLIHNFPFPA